MIRSNDGLNQFKSRNRCSLLDGLLFLEVRRRRRSTDAYDLFGPQVWLRSSLSRFTPRKGRETREKKLYIFKFEPQELADQRLDSASLDTSFRAKVQGHHLL